MHIYIFLIYLLLCLYDFWLNISSNHITYKLNSYIFVGKHAPSIESNKQLFLLIKNIKQSAGNCQRDKSVENYVAENSI